MENELVFCYRLFAVSIFGDSTASGYHISLNSGSVYTRSCCVLCQEHERDGCVIENINVRGVNSHLTWEMALKLQLSTFHFDPFLFLRPSKSME